MLAVGEMLLDGPSSSSVPEGPSLDLVASLFHKQAKRLEAQLLQQLQDKRVIEHMHTQLVATSGLVESLEVQRVTQAQQIEQNMQRALLVYEQARVMRQQQVHLRRVIGQLRSDLRIMRGMQRGEDGEGVATGPAEPEVELPTLAELLPGFGDGLAAAAGATAARAAATGATDAAVAVAATVGGALAGAPAGTPAGTPAGAPGFHGGAAPSSVEPPLARLPPEPPSGPADTALGALALLSTVASATCAKSPCIDHPPPSTAGMHRPNANPTAPADAPASEAPTAASISRHLAATSKATAAASSHSYEPAAAMAAPSTSVPQQGGGNSRGHRPRHPSPLAPAGTHRVARTSSAASSAAATAASSIGGRVGSAPSSSHEGKREKSQSTSSSAAAAEASSAIGKPPLPTGNRHTTLTEHSLTAHDGGMAAAGMAGPGAMGMWMSGTRKRSAEALAVRVSPAAPEHSSGGRSASKRAVRDEGAHGKGGGHGKNGGSAARVSSSNGHSSDSGNNSGSDATSLTALVSDGARSGSDAKLDDKSHESLLPSKAPSPSSPTALDAPSDPSAEPVAALMEVS